MTDVHLDVLRDILATLNRIESANAGRPLRTLTAEDRKTVLALVQAVSESIGIGITWTVRELHEEAAHYQSLAHALEPFGSGARKLGKLLARCEGVPVHGYRVEKGAELKAGLVWRVERV